MDTPKIQEAIDILEDIKKAANNGCTQYTTYDYVLIHQMALYCQKVLEGIESQSQHPGNDPMLRTHGYEPEE